MTTVAEGVETQAQLDELVLAGCTAVQGYLFSPPRPGAEILAPIVVEELARHAA